MKFKKFTMLALAALSMLSLASCNESKKDSKTTGVVTQSNIDKDDKNIKSTYLQKIQAMKELMKNG